MQSFVARPSIFDRSNVKNSKYSSYGRHLLPDRSQFDFLNRTVISSRLHRLFYRTHLFAYFFAILWPSFNFPIISVASFASSNPTYLESSHFSIIAARTGVAKPNQTEGRTWSDVSSRPSPHTIQQTSLRRLQNSTQNGFSTIQTCPINSQKRTNESFPPAIVASTMIPSIPLFDHNGNHGRRATYICCTGG